MTVTVGFGILAIENEGGAVRNIGIIAIIMVIVVGCGLFKGEKEYMPLDVGNEWFYTMTIHLKTTQNDTVIQDTTYTETYKTEITGEAETTTGVTVFVNITTFTTNTDTGYLEKRDDDIYYYEFLSDTSPYLILDYPLDDGKTWTSQELSYEVIGDEDVEVGAGSFKCKKVKQIYGAGWDMISYIWYADGVGMVKSTSADTSETAPNTIMITEIEQVLDDYTVK